MKVTILGCGSSSGVPQIGCDCAVCTSANPKNKRSRVSAFIETQGKNLLIDTSPDLRQQALRQGIRRIDAVLYTHDHADHTQGLDDLRSFNVLSGEEIPVYANAHTMAVLQKRFAYAFMPKPQNIWYRPCVTPHVLPDLLVHDFTVGDVPVRLFEQLHGKVKTFGYRIGDFAYSTDTDDLPDAAFEALAGVQIWVVDCLRYTHSYTHSHLEKTLSWIERLKPRQAILTHMAHEFDYDTLLSQLPAGVEPAYDGLVIEC